MTASFADNEIWHVLMDGNDLKRLNVDQLDDAFRLSLVDASTMVWKAGMKTWQRLGSVAGIEDEPEDSITRHMGAPPPPPRPMARPTPKPPSPSRAPNPFTTSTANPFAMTAPQSFHTAVTPVFAAPLVAPVFMPQLTAPDPYMLPKRRAAIPSEVDFRRSSGGVRWGRWLVGLLLITGGVLGAYRQNLLREGARRFGVENKYLYAEKRAVTFINATAPYSLKNALTRLALLPGPNAMQESATAALRAPEPTPAAAAPAIAAASEPSKPSPSEAKQNEPEVKTVSLDSLPVLSNDAPATAKAAPAAVAPVAKAKAVVTKAEPKAAVRSSSETPRPRKAEKPEPVAKAEPEPKPEPKAKPVSMAPVASDSFLKAAIRASIAADSTKKK